ncbi:MAG: MBL fold metallo-hydrolase [Oscillospiraceae bacterium]
MFELSSYKGVTVAQGLNENMGAHIKVFLYVVDGMLIDCGAETLQEEIIPFLRSQTINKLALTHLHEDHCGLAAWVEENLGVPIYLNPADIAEANLDAEYAEYRHLTWGDRRAFHPLPMPKILNTPKYSFEIIETPGHLPHHNVLYEKSQGWLFSGDLYVRSKMRFCSFDENMKEYIGSLEKVLKLDFNTVFCAHAGVLENGREKLTQKLDFLKELQQKVNDRRKQGKTDEEIDSELFPDEQIITAVSDGEWTSLNIVKTI